MAGQRLGRLAAAEEGDDRRARPSVAPTFDIGESAGVSDMKHIATTIRYDGPALRGHEMDVQDLAPALLALADIVKITNSKLNCDRVSIRVLVNADVEQKCFQLDLSLVQSWLDQATTFFGKEDLATAKQIAEIIGLAGPPSGGLLWLLKKLYAKKAEPAGTTFNFQHAGDVTIISIPGEALPLRVPRQTAELAQDSRVIDAVKTVLEPLRKEGYEDFTVEHAGTPMIKVDRVEAGHIREHAVALPERLEAGEMVATSRAQVEIVTAQFKGAAQWGLWWTGRNRPMKVDDAAWLEAFQAGRTPDARPGAWLDVMLEVTQPKDKALPATFVVKKVLGVLPPEPPQPEMLPQQ